MLRTRVTFGYYPGVKFNATNSIHVAAGKTKLDGCMLNEHNTDIRLESVRYMQQVLPWAHPSRRRKRHLDRFSRFWRAH